MSSEVGSGHYAILPSFKGFRRAVDREVDSSGRSAAQGFSRAMGKGGDVAGGLAGRGFSRGFQKSATVQAALRGVQREVREAAAGVSKARLAESDAAGRVRVAETKLAEARKKYAADSSQVVAAEERLAAAQRKQTVTSVQLQGATSKLAEAKKVLASAQAGVGRGSAVWAQMGRDVKPLGDMLGRAGLAAQTFYRTSKLMGPVRSTVDGLSMAWTRVSGTISGLGPVVFKPLAANISDVAKRTGSWISSTVAKSPVLGTAVAGIGKAFSVAGTAAGSLLQAGATAARGLLGPLGAVAAQIAPIIGRGFQAAVSTAGRAASQIGNAFKTTLGGAVAAGVAALGVAVTKGFSRLTAIDEARAKLTGLGNDGGAVAKIMSNASASVKGTAFGLGEAATVAAAAVAAQIKPGAQLEAHLKRVANNASAAGISMGEMGSIFNKAATQANGVQNDVISQLADKGIPIYAELGKQMGVTAGEVFKLASEGKVNFETFSKAAEAAAGTVAEEMGKTVPGAFKNLGAAMGRIGANLFGGISQETGEMFGLYAKVGPLLASITAALGPVEEIARRIGELIDGKLGPGIEALTAKFEAFGQGKDAANELASKLSEIAPILGIAAAAALPLLAGFLAKLPLIGSLFSGLGGGLMAGLAPILAAGGIVALLAIDPATLGPAISGIVSALVNGIGGAVDGLVGLLGTLVPTLAANLAANAPLLAEGFMQLLEGLAGALETLIPALVTAITTMLPAVVTALTSALPLLLQGGITLLLALVQGVVSAIPQLIVAVVGVIPQLVTSIVAALPLLIAGALQLFLGLVAGLTTALPQILTAVINAIPQLITGIVSQIPALIEGAISLFLGMIDGLGQAIPQVIVALITAIPQLITALVSALPQLIVGAVQLFLGIVSGLAQAIPAILTAVVGMIPQIVGAIGGAIPQLVSAGGDLIAGLVQGISGAASAVMDAIGGVVTGAIDWAKGLLGIKSPSRVFKSIGNFLGQGFAIGITASTSKVKASTDKLVKLVSDQFDKLADKQAASRKREKALASKLAGEKIAAARKVGDLEAKLKSNLSADARRRAERDLADQRKIATLGKAATAKALAEERANGKALAALRKTNSTKLIASIKSQGKALEKVAAQREKIAERMKDATAALEDAIAVRDDWAADVQSQVSSLGALAGRTSVDSMTGNLKAQIESAKEFGALMDQLMKQGLDKASVEELTQAFAQDGSLATVRALAAGGEAAVSEIVGLRKELDKVGAAIGKSTGTNLYQAGVDAAAGLVKGLESQAAALEKAAKKLSDALVKSVKKALGIKSPSRVFRDQVGLMVPLGVLDGMQDAGAARKLDAASRSLVPVHAAGVRRSAAQLERAVPRGSSAAGDPGISVVVEGDASEDTAYEIAQKVRMLLKQRRVGLA